MAERRSSPWIAFIAGMVVMLALALIWFAWQGRHGAGDAAEAALRASEGVKIAPPRIPEAPRLPDAPIPVPK